MNIMINQEFNFISMLSMIREKKKFIISFVFISLVLITITSFIIPTVYDADASVLPPDESDSKGGLSSLAQAMAGGSISLGSLGKSNKSELFGEMISSRVVAEYIVNNCNLKKYPQYKFKYDEDLYKALISSISVKANRSGIILISASAKTTYFPSRKDKDTASALSARIANAAIDGLNFINKTKSTSKAKKKLVFINRVLADNKLKLDSVARALQEFQEKNKVLALEEQTKAILTNAVAVGAELSKAEVELGIVLQDYSTNSPVAKAYQGRVSDLTSQYNKTQMGGLVPNDAFSIPLKNVPELIRIYTNLMRDQKILTQVILYLETQKYQEAIQEESDIPTVEALDRAVPPIDNTSPSRKLMLILTFIISSILAISYVYAKAFWKGKLFLKQIDTK
jgi:uncharacterized protein involved in exopolysaccharide biosynthesis